MSYKFLQQIIVLAVALGAVFFYVQPKFVEIRGLQEEVTEYQEAVNRATEFNDLLNSLLNRINALSRTDLVALETFLPAEVDSVLVARDLETIAVRNNMLVESISLNETADNEEVQAVQSEEYYSEMGMEEQMMEGMAPQTRRVDTSALSKTRVDISVTGRYANFIAFLESLERNEYPLSVVELAVGGQDAGESTQTASDISTYTVSVETYSLETSI